MVDARSTPIFAGETESSGALTSWHGRDPRGADPSGGAGGIGWGQELWVSGDFR